MGNVISTAEPPPLDGRVIVVTGGASGVGRAAARLAARGGAGIMLADRDAEAVRATAAELQEAGHAVESFTLDVADEGQVENLVAATLKGFGRIDGLVTSAGIERRVSALEMTTGDFERVLRVNLTGTFLCATAVARSMVAAGVEGSIVTISSALAFSGRLDAAPYSASKGGVVTLTKSLALEWGQYGIRVNSVAPGLVDTPIIAELPKPYREAYASRTPLGRIGTADDVAKVVRFLLTDDAAYVTGQTIVVNGGFLMPS